jgi:hypothetical protein
LADWSQLLPEGEGPAEVEAAKREVAVLRAKVPAAREALTAAQAAVTTAEADDRTRMAEAWRERGAATADASSVEKAQHRVALVRRQGEALLVAVADAERVLGEVVHAQRDRWLSDARRREKTARGRAAKLVGELRSALEGMAREREAIFWLEPERGLDRQQRAGGAGIGCLAGPRSSAFQAANGTPVAPTELLRWLAEVIEPAPQQASEPVAAG